MKAQLNLDVKAIRDRLRDVIEGIRDVKGATRRWRGYALCHGPGTVPDRHVVRCRRAKGCGKAIMFTRHTGANLSSAQGKDLYILRREATMLCTMLAMRRGRCHDPKWLLEIDRNGTLINMNVLVASMQYYKATPVVAPLETAVVVEEEPQVQTVSVLEVK